MAYTGIFCTVAEMQFKAGENRDATGDVEANHNQIASEVESYINNICRYNFSDNYASLNADVRALLKEAASNLCAVYLIQYNMSGYSSRIEAEDMINILMSRFNDCIELLKDQKVVTYLTSGTTPAVGGDSISTDELTITKNASGVISVKTGNGANQAIILGAGGTFAKNLLDATTAYPIGSGSMITNLVGVSNISITSDLSTTSTTFVDMTGLTKTFTAKGGMVLIIVTLGQIRIGGVPRFALLNDSTTLRDIRRGATTDDDIQIIWTGTITAGSHTVKMQWKTASGTLYAWGSSSTAESRIDIIDFGAGST